ncbi:hypothetical protein QUW36_11500 [Clostridium cadaveris]|uniref:hypothetical protein n=1 Tax=Clostridium cadaveris TaxID=1529 RepID=UPI0025A3A0EB|nr:hypothetical protein [Clostridium cadaveris]MDM8312682.1 hypothetical protein [Clostridium cadaveris]
MDNDEFDEFIKTLNINLAELEKSGAFFLTLGYSHFFKGAELTILEVLETNFTGNSSDETTLLGQQFVVIGYTLLYIVASKRYYEKKCRTSEDNKTINLIPYKIIVESYFLSIVCNYRRYVASSQILKNLSED